MRRAAKTDANQTDIVATLRKIGATVQPLHGVGSGCPDLLVGYRGADGVARNYLVEVKDGAKPPSARKLTPDQVEWHIAWRGQVAVADSIEAAIAVVRGET